MADETNIKINLVTAGDPKGAQQVEKAIDEVKVSAAEAAQANERLESASKRVAAAEDQQAEKLKTTARAHDQVEQSQNRVEGSSRNMGNALLQGSRAIQDMQYGLAGAVNNLEGIASALGLGAGVAGVVTVLAVALQAAAPHIEAFFNSLDASKIKTDGLKALQDQLAGTPQVMSFAERAAAALTEELKRQNEELKAQSEALKFNLELLTKKAEVEGRAAKNKLESDIADIKAQGLPPEQEAAAIAAKKSAALDEQFVREQQLAEERVKAADQETINQAQGVKQAVEGKKQADETLKRAIDYENTLAEITRTEKEAKDAKSAYRAEMEKEIPNFEEAQKQAQIAREKEEALQGLEKKRADILTSGPMPDKGTAQAAVATRDEQLKKRVEAFQEAEIAAQRTREMEAIGAQGRVNDYNAERVKIAREKAPGVYDAANMAPGGSAGITPLEDNPFGLGGPLEGGQARRLPAPVRPAASAPEAAAPNLGGPLENAANSLQNSPLGNIADTLGAPLEKAASTLEQMARGSQQLQQRVQQFEQRVSTVESQLRNTR